MFYGSDRFAIEVEFSAIDLDPHPSGTWDAGEELNFKYRIEISNISEATAPFMTAEYLECDCIKAPVFRVLDYLPNSENRISNFEVKFYGDSGNTVGNKDFRYFSVLWNESQTVHLGKVSEGRLIARQLIEIALKALGDIRFLDLSPDAMRQPAFPGQTILGDRGENLSSVLQDICQDPKRKEILLSWLQELTPMDAKDFDFPSDFSGKILLHLVEENGKKTSAYSASDGTLRFLGMLAALLGKDSSNFYFLEEIENGIHPNRLYLLLQLLEQEVSRSQKQIVITTHSPLLLHYLSKENWEFASLIYRLPGHPESQIERILDLPDARRIAEEKTLGRLLESGWLENTTNFLAEDGTEP